MKILGCALGTSFGFAFLACSGATDPNPPGADGGATTTTPSDSGVRSAPDVGSKGLDPVVSPGGVMCGTSFCRGPNVCCTDGALAECKADASECAKETISCDESADCPDAKCCAEESTQTPKRISTYCRPSCFTGLPRVEVCIADAQCGSQRCQRDWPCTGIDQGAISTCGPVGTCQ